MRKRGLALVASGVLLLALLALAGPDALAARLAGADLGWVGVAFGSILLSLLCWSQGLTPLLAVVDAPVPAGRTAVAYTASMLGRQIVPVGAVGGPAITAFTIHRQTDLSYDETLAVVTVAEFLSTVTSLLLAAAGITYLVATGPEDPGLALVAGLLLLVAVALVLGVALVWYRRGSVSRLVRSGAWILRAIGRRLSPRLAAWASSARASRSLGRFYDTVDALRGQSRAVFASTCYHLLGWILVVVSLWASALALDLEVAFALACVVVPTSLLVDVLPLPGGLGGIEVALAGLLVLLAGLDLAGAAAVVVLYRLATYWFVIALGAAAAFYSSMSVRDILDAGMPEEP